MISPWDIYWVMQLDRIIDLFTGITIAGGVGALLALCMTPVWVDGSMCAPKLRKWIVGVPLAVLLFGAAGAAFIPSTKTAAAMIVVPAIANNETIQEEAGDLYKIAKEGLRELVKPDKAEKAE